MADSRFRTNPPPNPVNASRAVQALGLADPLHDPLSNPVQAQEDEKAHAPGELCDECKVTLREKLLK